MKPTEPSSSRAKANSAVIPGSASGLGSFGGVFTPSILTILGVIMYLRFGWVVGNVGLWGTLAIVTLSTSITLLTALSISQIATDQRVRAGGAYYMISRSLGIETGGAVGIPLYFAQALSVALYTIGFAESLQAVLPFLDQRVVALITTIGVTALALKSAQTAIRAQYIIMGAIVLSLVSFFFGGPVDPSIAITPVSGEAPGRAGFWGDCLCGIFSGCHGHYGRCEFVRGSARPAPRYPEGNFGGRWRELRHLHDYSLFLK